MRACELSQDFPTFPIAIAPFLIMTTSPNNNDSKEENKKLFYTTSDMLKTINKSIQSLDSPDDAISPRVELQRRMPDGSTRRANDADLRAADFESKMKQVS